LLTPEQRAAYDERGYVVVRDLFGASELARWRDRFQDLVLGRVERPDGMLVMRDVMVAKGVVATDSPLRAVAKVQDFQDDPVLWEYVRHPRLVDLVAALLGPDVAAIHTMLINKPPGVDGRHPLHQDLLYFPFRPAAAIVAAWTALDACTRENGCLVAVPGTHRGELLAHENPDWEHLNTGYFGATGVGAGAERVHLEMAPGDTVFFHPLLLHGSGRNRSDAPRPSISAHYASPACRFLADGHRHGGRPYRLVRGVAHPGGILDTSERRTSA
jgi:phytanoyl-CoA hydroxylase